MQQHITRRQATRRSCAAVTATAFTASAFASGARTPRATHAISSEAKCSRLNAFLNRIAVRATPPPRVEAPQRGCCWRTPPLARTFPQTTRPISPVNCRCACGHARGLAPSTSLTTNSLPPRPARPLASRPHLHTGRVSAAHPPSRGARRTPQRVRPVAGAHCPPAPSPGCCSAPAVARARSARGRAGALGAQKKRRSALVVVWSQTGRLSLSSGAAVEGPSPYLCPH
eukprot:354565-Chlamydomonas_euryale.AAC.12